MLSDETLIIHSSDYSAQRPFAKWNLYDVGIQVPLISEWPGVVPPGSTSDALVQWTDLLPTLIEIGGGTVPNGLDSRSFAPGLLDETVEHRDRIYAIHTGDGNTNVTSMCSLRRDGFKYILNLYPNHPYTTHIDRGGVPDRAGIAVPGCLGQGCRNRP